VDVTTLDRRFTWYNLNGSVMSHIDRDQIERKNVTIKHSIYFRRKYFFYNVEVTC